MVQNPIRCSLCHLDDFCWPGHIFKPGVHRCSRHVPGFLELLCPRMSVCVRVCVRACVCVIYVSWKLA